ncbi:MAG: hypothetical protein FWD73_16145 [Polyangiaceae bacterium]|nr:hypothetical protein [Polyangiaceae bacterium]
MTTNDIRDIPKLFRSSSAFRVLNVLAVGFSLAAATGSVIGIVEPPFRYASSLPTLLCGLLWALALRGKTTFYWGWVAAIPLAMANSAATVFLLMTPSNTTPTDLQIMIPVLIGAIPGAIVWIPALIATLLCFGVPIAWAHRRAKQGLAGEEKGEMVVGAVSAIIAIGAMLLTREVYVYDNPSMFTTSKAVVAAFAFIAIATGSLAVILAFWRGRERRAFVRQVEAGEIVGYRVDVAAGGKALVRVAQPSESYRVANIDEPIVMLDDHGNATTAFDLTRSLR